MQLRIEMTGTSPLVMHNIRLANQRDEIVLAIKELTSKPARHKTQDDADEIERLEFMGGLYWNEQDGIHLPTWNIVRSFEEAAKATRDGKNLMRAVTAHTMAAPLIYDGPATPELLWQDRNFRWSTMVGVQRAKTSRMRPLFRTWACSFDVELLTDTLDQVNFERVVERAGRVEGVGDARKLGYGRFSALVKVV
jgi:hypothetical protein